MYYKPRSLKFCNVSGVIPGLCYGDCGRRDLLPSLQPDDGNDLIMFLYQVPLTASLSLLKATNNVEDFGHSTHLLGATTLRNVLGTKCLAEILSER